MAASALLRRPLTALTFQRATSRKASMASTRANSTLSSYLITPTALNNALTSNAPTKLSTAPRIIPLCGSWFLPNDPSKRSGRAVFANSHIPTARFFDLDAISDTSSPYPHMLPSPQTFADAMSELGVHRDDTLVVYDSAELGIFSAPRVAWTLRVFGHPAVHILNNYRLYCEQGFPTESGEQRSFERSQYPVPELDGSLVTTFEEVKGIAQDANKEGREEIQILDARSHGRWEGSEPEPRPGLSSGHIPGSLSVPVPDLLDPKTKAFLPREELERVLQQKGVDASKPVISSCGTGVTATVIDAALQEVGYAEGSRRVYDGSWTEWAQRVRPSENLIVKIGQ